MQFTRNTVEHDRPLINNALSPVIVQWPGQAVHNTAQETLGQHSIATSEAARIHIRLLPSIEE